MREYSNTVLLILKTKDFFQSAIASIHPVMHNEVMENTNKYLEENQEMRKLLIKLKSAKKQLFLITNSPYRFV